MAKVNVANSAFKFTWDDTGVTNFLRELQTTAIRFDAAVVQIYAYIEEMLLPMIQNTIKGELHPANFANFMARRTKVTVNFEDKLLKVTVAGKLENELPDDGDSDRQGTGGPYNLWAVQEFGKVIGGREAEGNKKFVFSKDIGGVKVVVKQIGSRRINKHVGAIRQVMPAIAVQIQEIIHRLASMTASQVMEDVLKDAQKKGRGWKVTGTVSGSKALAMTGITEEMLPEGGALSVFRSGQIAVRGAGGQFIKAPNIPHSIRKL